MSVTAAKGFVANGMAAGIKASGAPDLAIVATANGAAVAAAGVFTTNLVAAAPVQISRGHLRDGTASAVVLNSGNANAATGQAGRDHALRMCELTAKGLGVEMANVLVCSTGLIGIPMPFAGLESGIPLLAPTLGESVEAGNAAATAIMTTDTVAKQATATFVAANGATVTVGGMAKGAAMLSPAMATMLCVITSDAAIDQQLLQAALINAVGDSFDCLNVDGARSTNDTVLVLANGEAGNERIESATSTDAHQLQDALTKVCASIAEQMARDAEGATTFARVIVRGARSRDDARKAARAITNSQLVQCSLYGRDPYWGRVISECGASGAYFDPELVNISYQGVQVCEAGIALAHDTDALATLMTTGTDVLIEVDLNNGPAQCTMLTTDLGPGYIDENMGTS